MSTSTFVGSYENSGSFLEHVTGIGNSDGLATGLCPAPPPPPPPPPVPGQVPAMRINTAEAPTIRRPQIAGSDAYEPPAAIQNAMLTKDKKPFTYTPGMGGKLDLSQIRSPRMARRVAKNANDEGIEGPPKSALEPKPTPAPNAGANLFVQPQVAIPVFPANVPVQPPANRTPQTPPTPPANRTPPTSPASKTPTNGLDKQPELSKVTKADAKVTPAVTISVQPSTPESPGTPTQVTLAKAPTPWLQNKNKPQEELPEWAKRPSSGKQGSSPDSPTSPPVYVSFQQPPQWQQAQQKQQPAQQRPQSQQPQQCQYQQPSQPGQQQQKRPYSSPPGAQNAQSQQQERVIPIRIEDRPSVFDVSREAGHHQFKQPSPHHQQRWGQPPAQNQMQNQAQQPATPTQPQQSSGGAFIIPVIVEGSEKKPAGGPASNAAYSQPIVRNNTPSAENQAVRMAPQRGPVPVAQPDSGPVQSRSFRVLQKITDTDSTNDVDPEQIRKLQLSEDDRILMNRVKEQVDNDCFLHQEEDPRYRGAAIPSRAFRFLQTMTESGDIPIAPATPRPQSAINKRQNRNSKTFEETQANLPPSEQQVPEPRKYMGSAIPSRSFRILQAMTAPESVATQENRQADYTCQTENNVPGNQQGVFLPPCPPPFWSPDGGWWGYYPLPYPGVANGAYPHPDHTAYIYFPIYSQSYPGYPQYDANPPNTDKTACTVAHPSSCAAPAQIAACDRNGQGSGIVIPEMEATSAPEDKGNEGEAPKDSADLNGLNGLPRWRGNGDRGNSVSRTASSNSKDSDCTTAMNITDEEEIPEAMAAPEANVRQPDSENDLEKKPCANGSLNVAVPNYTYIDTSDSSDSTDSESQSDNESVTETSKSDSVSEETTSDSDDSDSYLAYSMGLNPQGRFDKDVGRSGARNGSSKEASNDGNGREPSVEKDHSDSEGEDANGQVDGHVEETGSFPHKLSVIYEDVEHADSESPRPQEVKGEWNQTPFEATDDPPDEQDTTTVSVSLPLRFKFSVSENNEDVTTVIVGDSTVKPERSPGKEEARSAKPQEHRSPERANEVSANFLVNNDTSVDFTVKSEDKRRSAKHSKETEKEEAAERKPEKGEDTVPHVNFTLRKIPTRLSRMNCGETVETEFTVKRKTSARKEEGRDKGQDCSDTGNKTVLNGEALGEGTSPAKVTDNTVYDSNVEESIFETREYSKNIPKPEVVVSECKDPGSLGSAKPKAARNEKSEDSDSSRRNGKEDDPEKATKEPGHLLSVQNSRDETDDEDSGVTSDMSRMISEVDTDSECTSTRNRRYQRTQTHSRLFKLLNDDSVLPEGTESTPEQPSRRDYLSLPLKSSFNYDESYCSNYSSGLTSPDYSPVCEQTWRRLHDTEQPDATTNPKPPDQNGDASRHGHPPGRQERGSCKDDPYYQAWKTSKSPSSDDHDVLPSRAFKVLESRRPLWSYKVNVLCPRIRSTKSVPAALGAGRNDPTFASPNPSAYVTLRNDRC